MVTLSWSSELVIKSIKCNADFTPLDKMSKLWFINQFIVFSLNLYREIKKKLSKFFFFQTIDVSLGLSQGFPETLRVLKFTKCLILDNIALAWFSLAATLLIWWCQLRFLSTMIPKYFTESVGCSRFPFSLMCNSKSVCFVSI